MDKTTNKGSSSSINDLPEDCLAEILSHAGPIQSCRLATVSPAFTSASRSSVLWDKFLPPDYRRILSVSSDDEEEDRDSLPKKQLFISLCRNPVLIDAGRKSFSLDERTGKKCFTMSARDLEIEWGDTPFYWRWIPHPDSRFDEVAELVDVCWFEIKGKIETQLFSRSTQYAAYLVFKYLPESRTAGARGFHRQDFAATVGGSTRTVGLEIGTGDRRREFWMRNSGRDDDAGEVELPKQRKDGWIEAELGEFRVGEEMEEDGVLEMGLKEVILGPKSGMVVLGIEVRPKCK